MSEMKNLLDQTRMIASKERLERYPSLQKGREDVLVAGIIICLVILKCYGFNEMTVTEGGILEGLMCAESFPAE
jgi:exopolyphosphatase/guanosine-5'-triphosphate,3'-diphosphate pyrophosphatase